MSAAKETMTSRQRVIRAIEHKEVDRMPIDLGLHLSSGISAFAYYNLREYLGLSTNNIKIIDPMQFLARVDEDVLELFHCDCYHLHPGFYNPVIYNPRGKYHFITEQHLLPQLNEKGEWILKNNDRQARMPKNGYFFDGNWIHPFDQTDERTLDRLAIEAERIYKETDYFTMFMGWGAFMGGLDFLIDMIEDPDKIHEINKRQLEWQIEQTKRVIEKMGRYVQCIGINSDLGTQSGPMVNPALYEELVFPYLKEYCDFVHRESDMKIFLHSCGSIEPFIPLLIEAGVDILNPVQISANNMEPEMLKEKYGDKITFWGGGCDTQNILPFASPEEVRENVRYLVNIFKKGSGYVFNPVHNIMGDVPPENIVAMFDEAYKNSFY